MTELNLNEIKAHHERTVAAEGDQLTVSEHERGLLLAEVERLQKELELAFSPGMYLDIQKVLDEALGTQEADGAGTGIAADIALLAEQKRAAVAEVERLTGEGVSLSIRREILEDRCAQMERDHAETVAELAEVTRQRDAFETALQLAERNYQHVAGQLHASCVCNTGPDTDGPEEDCPVHGRDEYRPLALRAADQRVRELHRPYRLYDECGHSHQADEPGVVVVEDIGPVCQDGYLDTICLECCAAGGECQTEECASGHRHHSEYLCPTIRALDGGERP